MKLLLFCTIKLSILLRSIKYVAIEGPTYKNAITATFGITYGNRFLPIQFIYDGKILRCLPRFDFHKAFSLNANEKHFSNTTESLKLLDEIIIPYLTSERKRKELDVNHIALLLMDVFRGQMTDPVLLKLRGNMTNLFQPIDLIINGAAKSLFREKIYWVVQWGNFKSYSRWYSIGWYWNQIKSFSTETFPS